MDSSRPSALPKWLRFILISPIIALMIASIMAFAWANDKALSLGHFGFIKTTPQGQMAFTYDQSIMFVNREKQLSQQMDMAALGLNIHGDLDFFSNGDVLVYHGAKAFSLLEGLFHFLRFQSRAGAPTLGEEGFYRCETSNLSCSRFARGFPAQQASFGVSIDRTNDTVYVTDTSAFSLYKISESGEWVLSDLTDLKFPNKMAVEADGLWLADTNHHRIVKVKKDGPEFGLEIDSREATLDQVHRWPSNLVRVGNEWWVSIADGGMGSGRIKRLPAGAETLSEVILPEGSDALGLVFWQGAVWVTDFRLQALYQISLDGRKVETANLGRGFQDKLDLVAQEEAYYQQLSQFCLIAFVLFILAGCGVALKLEPKQTVAVLKGRSELSGIDLAVETTSPGEIFWLENKLIKKYKQFVWIAAIIIAIFIASFVFGIYSDDSAVDSSLLLLSGGVFAAISLSFILLNRSIKQRSMLRLGILDNALVMENETGRYEAEGEALHYGRHHVGTAGMVMPLGNAKQPLFDRDQLVRWVHPRLKQARKLSAWELFTIQWRSRDQALMSSLWFLALFIVLSLLMAFINPS